jgi:hypothetical protein
VNSPDIDQTLDFLTAVFGATEDGDIFFSSLSSNGGGICSLASRDADAIETFVTKHNEPTRGSYFCPSVLRSDAKGRSKEVVQFLTGIHCDIDFKTVDKTPAEIRRAIDQTALPASVIVESGGGLHCYWLFREGLEATEDNVARAESLMHALADHLAGDHAVAHSAALMRLPGTWNNKRETPILTRILESRPAARYELEDLEEWLADARPLLAQTAAIANNPKVENSPFAAYAASAGTPVDGDAELAAMTFGDGEHGIHRTQTRVIASMVARGVGPDEITQKVLDATKAAYGRSGITERWDWKKEVRAIHKSIRSFQKKAAARADEDNVNHASSTDEKRSVRPHTLAETRDVFQKWFGKEYDLGTLDAVLAVAAAERLPGDPPWLLIISGPGNAKTETVQAISGLGGRVVSTITSEGALLSASPRKSRAKNATGGLLRQIGDRGILAIKDFTSIISSNREVRTQVLAALREIYDGHWVRNVGSDGGQCLEWRGRIIVIGACTTVWDQAHAVVSVMGDRFILVRSNSSSGRIAAGMQAVRNTGREPEMRRELAEAVAGLVGQANPDCPCVLTAEETTRILQAADIVTLARTGVETDYRGDIIDAHAPEMPTRFAKQLTQVMRGGLAIGMRRPEAMALAIRCARNSMPPLRLAILEDIAANPGSRIIDVRRRLQRPRATADRALQALHVLGLLVCDEEEEQRDDGPRYIRHYSLAQSIVLGALSVPDLSVDNLF